MGEINCPIGAEISDVENLKSWCGKAKKSIAEPFLPIQSEIEAETSGGYELSERDCNVWRRDKKILDKGKKMCYNNCTTCSNTINSILKV